MIDIDLHLHTNYSDGVESPEEMVRRAQRLGLKTIAITDHDGIGGVVRARLEGEKIGVKVVSGLEFSTTLFFPNDSFDGEEHHIHMLGYGIDLKNQCLTLKMTDLIQKRMLRNKKMQNVFAESGIVFTDEELKENSPSGYVGKVSFARVLLEKGYTKSFEEAFLSEKFMRSPSIRVIRKEKTEAQEAIRIIHEAGGKAFFAHPFQLSYPSLMEDGKGFSARLFLVLKQLKEDGLDGLECYYPTHDQAQTDCLLALADQIGLLVSVGSDDHGPGVRKIKEMNSFQVSVDAKRLEWIKEFL